MERHFNVTVYIADGESKKFLMIKHKKLQKWLPPGGHIGSDEIPDEAAKREVLEETGLEINLYGDAFPLESGLVRPFGIQRNIIEEGKHEHLDLIYFAVAQSNIIQTVQNTEETEGINWFGIDEIRKTDFNTFPATRKWCERFHTMLTENNLKY